MADSFMERVANLAGRTAKALDQLAGELDQAGFVAQSVMLRSIAKSNRKLCHDCSATTQPIEIESYNLTVKIRRIMEDAREVAELMIEEGRPGYREVSEAADIMQAAIDSQE